MYKTAVLTDVLLNVCVVIGGSSFNTGYADSSSSLLVFSPKVGFGRNQSPVRRLVWLWYTAF